MSDYYEKPVYVDINRRKAKQVNNNNCLISSEFHIENFTVEQMSHLSLNGIIPKRLFIIGIYKFSLVILF